MSVRDPEEPVPASRPEPSVERLRPVAARIRLIAWAAMILAFVVSAALAYTFDVTHGFNQLRISGRDAFPILSSVVAFLLSAAVVWLRPETLAVGRLIRTSVAWSLTLLVALASTWYLIDQDVREFVGIGERVVSQDQVDRFISANVLELPPGQIEPIRIPTGLFIESIEFSTANDVEISAFIWQRYGEQVPADIPRGFSLPGATREAVDTMDSYRVTNADGSTLLSWHVHLTVRQQYDYRNFPLDRQDVWVRLWPEVPDRRVVLVPDFASYPDIRPASLPGLSKLFVGGGWQAEHTFFSYAINDDNAYFGFPAGATPRGFAELVFNVAMKRSFVEPFLDDMLLAIVVALLLFGIVVLNAQDIDRRTRFGITTFGVLATAGTLLFTVLTKHNQIRSEVSPGQLVYIEVLPLLLYITILLTVANSILLLAAPPGRFRLISFEDNLLPNVIYWPALLGTLWLVTIFVFNG